MAPIDGAFALTTPQKILFRIFLKLPAKFPGEEDVQTIFSTANGATITPLNKRWIDDPGKRVNVESHIPVGWAAETGELPGVFAYLASDDAATGVDGNTNGAGPFQCLIHSNLAAGCEEPRNVGALPATNEVLRRFNRDTEWLAAGILGAVVCAALLTIAPLIQEGQPKAADQAKEERQFSGNALVNANPGKLSKVLALNAQSYTGEITSDRRLALTTGSLRRMRPFFR